MRTLCNLDLDIEHARRQRIKAERMGWTCAALVVGTLYLGLVAAYV